MTVDKLYPGLVWKGMFTAPNCPLVRFVFNVLQTPSMYRCIRRLWCGSWVWVPCANEFGCEIGSENNSMFCTRAQPVYPRYSFNIKRWGGRSYCTTQDEQIKLQLHRQLLHRFVFHVVFHDVRGCEGSLRVSSPTTQRPSWKHTGATRARRALQRRTPTRTRAWRAPWAPSARTGAASCARLGRTPTRRTRASARRARWASSSWPKGSPAARRADRASIAAWTTPRASRAGRTSTIRLRGRRSA